MATPRKLPSGKWNLQVRVKGFPQKTITRDSAADCEQAAKEYIASLSIIEKSTI